MPSKRLKGKQYRSANTSKAPSNGRDNKSPSEKIMSDSPTPNLVVEVIIPPRSNTVPKSSSPPIEISDNDDNAAPKRPPRHAKKDVTILISDDEGGDSGSDYEHENKSTRTAQNSEAATSEVDGMSVDEEDGSDAGNEAKVKVKPKAKPKPKPKAARKSKKAGGTDGEMDVDEAPSKGERGKKRKSEVIVSEGEDEDEDEDEKPKKKAKKEPKPKVNRADADPWKLKSSAVKKNWKEMHAPPLEVFHFHRLVIDEYTYLDGKTHSLITSLQATCRWVLSGTPPVHDFPSLKTIAVFLDIHLGIDDDGEGQSAQVKRRRREQTGESLISVVLLIY